MAVERQIQHEQDPNIRKTNFDAVEERDDIESGYFKGFTALMYAALYDNLKVAEILVTSQYEVRT